MKHKMDKLKIKYVNFFSQLKNIKLMKNKRAILKYYYLFFYWMSNDTINFSQAIKTLYLFNSFQAFKAIIPPKVHPANQMIAQCGGQQRL